MAINGMLASLDTSQRELAEREAEKQALLNAIPDIMFRSARTAQFSMRGPLKQVARRNSSQITEAYRFNELPQYEFLSAEVVHQGCRW